MRKSKPAVILLLIHLAIALSLALINPVSDYIIRQKGTEYTFAVDEAWLTGDFINYIEEHPDLISSYAFTEKINEGK